MASSASSLPATLAQAIAFLTRPLSLSYPAATVIRLQLVLDANLTALFASSWVPEDPLRGSGRRCLTLSPTCLPPRAIYAACLATGVQWFDWIAALGGREFDLFVDPGCISLRFGKGTRLITIWSEELATEANTFPDLPLATAASPHIHTQSKTLAQQLLEVDSAEDDELFAMIADEVSAPTWSTPVVDRFPAPVRSESPLSAISTDSRSSSRSSDYGSCFSYSSSARTESIVSKSCHSSTSSKLSRREKARQARVFVDTSKTEVTPYDGGKTTVLTGGVMLGAPVKGKPSRARNDIASISDLKLFVPLPFEHQSLGTAFHYILMSQLVFRAVTRSSGFSPTLRSGRHLATVTPGGPRPVPTRHDWTREEIQKIYDSPLLDLVYRASTVHRQYHDPSKIQLCTLMNIKTGGCSEDCSYCSQSSRYSTPTKASPLLQVEPVLEAARKAKENGSTRFCMGAAWRDLAGRKRGFQRILEMVREVRGMGMEVCTTLGMLTPEQAKQLKEAGLTAYNHNLDTSREYYPKVITTRSYDERLETISAVREAGISVCSGGILGLGEADDDRVGLIYEVARQVIPMTFYACSDHTFPSRMPEHPESFPVNALVPIPGTPLENNQRVPHDALVRTIATARVVMPETIIRLAAGRNTLSEAEQMMCFMAGANAVFTGEQMLTTPCSPWDADKEMMGKWGLKGMESFEQRNVAQKEGFTRHNPASEKTFSGENVETPVKAEDRARQRLRSLLPTERRSPSPPRLPHLRSPSPPLVAPYPPPVAQHLSFTSFVMDKSVTHSFRANLLDELEYATNSLIEGEAMMKRALGRLWQVINEDPCREHGEEEVVPKREDADSNVDEEELDRRYPRAQDFVPNAHKLFLTSYPDSGSPVLDPSQFTSPEIQQDSLEKALATLRELQDDGREYVERLEEIREGLGETRLQRNVVWDTVREKAIKEMQDAAFNAVVD
ncbi:hypothetical protein ID866_836 [Astraeus odoratus]|nr:hypothetical protein ID866_836 [Astraeus odoratus]